jgi:N-acetylneuraminic acid mutarotase
VVHNRHIYIFGGYDGINRVNDFYGYDIDFNTWRKVVAVQAPNNQVSGGELGEEMENTVPSNVPSPRHSHSAVVYEDSMFVFGGYDGHYRNDLYRYNFVKNTWT